MFATGVSAISRQEIGSSVFGGVLFATVLVLLFIPFMYVLIRSLMIKKTVSQSVVIEYPSLESEQAWLSQAFLWLNIEELIYTKNIVILQHDH